MSLNTKYLFLLLLTLNVACQQRRSVGDIPIDDFFKLQDKMAYRVSPDGLNISYFKLEGDRLNLYVEAIASGKSKMITRMEDKSILFYFWVSNNELIYYKESDVASHRSDIFIIGKDGKQERQLSKDDTSRLRILEDQLIDGRYLLVSSNQRDSTVFDVYRLNVRNGEMEMAAKNPGNITEWRTDAEGKLRLAVSTDGGNSTLLYRASEHEPFQPVMTNTFNTTFTPIAFQPGSPNIIYAISNVNRDKAALVEVDCHTGKELKVLFGSDTLNVTDATYSRKKSRLSFAVYETWKKEKHFLDESVRQIYEVLDSLLPKTETRILDRDQAENVFVVRTFTDRNPGSYYLYYADQRKLKKLRDFNPAIHEEEMCEMKPASFPSRDGLTIHGYLTLPNGISPEGLPVVVLPHDGPVDRTLWGYNAEVQFLANRGYAVFQVNYRGSSGYGKKFAAAGYKQWGCKIQHDIIDGVKWLIDQDIADPKRIGIYGSGFGGNVALNGACQNKGTFVCAASNSGIINLFTYLKSIPPYSKSTLQMYYEIIGDPLADADQMRWASPLFQADKINIPVFLAQNTKDQNTSAAEHLQLIRNLKKREMNVTYLEHDGISYPSKNQESRRKFYAALEQFLEVNLKNR
ncbi:putative peptidase [Pedobacter sp. BAL39]|uniref:S9 family peptidase n=1 Tax=Pedobacter sp. BAL39 TaxID=391596 RepID=UPI0001559DD2|nr:prolyl oligopeptidase family serine peptidase [Pedobacter sp. BAL39]EDM37387.1 putative peptidase [Pedobacter sp. BAL39]